MALTILGKPILSPLRLVIPLKFPEEDLKRFPWLGQGDRYYSLEKQIDPGGFSIPVMGHPCNAEGVPLVDSPKVVIKIPNVNDRDFTRIEQDLRTAYIRKQSIQEWAHVRKRLLTCKHANPIFDLGTLWIDNAQEMQEVYVTVQLFIENALPIKEWFVKRGLRGKHFYDEGKEIQDWHGISDWKEWLYIATLVAEGLAEVHSRRVIHADIWPPNIFITEDENPYVIFIDFGESFVVTPTGDPRTQTDHPYRAPERRGGEYVPTEQIDVYSFGKLLLYLAIGIEEKIPHHLHGHHRRAFVRNILFERNLALVKDNPQIVDIIAQCTAFDPVARPRMREVVEELKELSAKTLERTRNHLNLTQRLKKITTDIEVGFDKTNSIFMRFVDKQIAEVERLIDSCATEMIEMDGTRDHLIRALLILFNELKSGDSWTSITAPSVWQIGALGLDGRYATASIEAVRRGAAVHRTYIISIEELGLEWAEQLREHLENTGNETLFYLAKQFHRAILDFRSQALREGYLRPPDEFVKSHAERFVCVVESLNAMTKNKGLENLIVPGKFTTITGTSGLYLGITPVATLSHVRRLRIENPVSLMYVNREADEHNKWLLIMTDIRGRNENESGTVSTRHTPQLRGIRLYRSVMGVPRDRILGLERLMRDKSINIGSVIQQFAECVLAIPTAK